jgi:hypothetical protein
VGFIDSWRERGLLNKDQAALLSDIEEGRLISLSAELRALLYLGALLVICGVGMTVKEHFKNLGPAAIIASLTLAGAACMAYCFARGRPYDDGKVESPAPAFDYVLYIGCALIGILAGFLETQYHLLAGLWDYYLLASAFLCAALAYRFDNRLVLALGLFNLAAWFGIRFSRWDIPLMGLKPRAILFGILAVAAGRCLEGMRIKEHFKDTYYGVGLHVLCVSLLWGVFVDDLAAVYSAGLAGAAAAAIHYGLTRRDFQYFLYGTVYAYIGASRLLMGEVQDASALSLYFLLSAVALAALIFHFRKRLARE